MKKKDVILVLVLVGLIGYVILHLGGQDNAISGKIAGVAHVLFGIRQQPAAKARPQVQSTAPASDSEPMVLRREAVQDSIRRETGDLEYTRSAKMAPSASDLAAREATPPPPHQERWEVAVDTSATLRTGTSSTITRSAKAKKH